MQIILTGQQLNAILTVIASLLLIAALIMEYGFNLAPCPLCMMQRLWVVAFGLVAGIAMLLNATSTNRMLFATLTGVCALIGSGFSMRHIWIQNLPNDHAFSCSPGLDYMLEVLPLSDILRAMVVGSANCAEEQLVILGLSLPVLVLLSFIFLAIGATLHFSSKIIRDYDSTTQPTIK